MYWTSAAYFCLLTIAVGGLSSDVVYRLLSGRTGNGKTYISNKLGCNGKTGGGTTSTTKDASLCGDNIIDMVGLDDDNSEHEVDFGGRTIKLSGFTFPLWNLFQLLQDNKISHLEIYTVLTTDNMVYGGSYEVFKKFVIEDMGCEVTRVLNKFDDTDPDHTAKRQPGDIVVPKRPDSITLSGPACRVALAGDWKQRLVAADLQGTLSSIDLEHCDLMCERKRDIKKAFSEQPPILDLGNCGRDEVVGVQEVGAYAINVGPIGYSKTKTVEIKERKVDPECDRQRTIQVGENRAAADRLAEDKRAYHAILHTVNAELLKCSAVKSWQCDADKQKSYYD